MRSAQILMMALAMLAAVSCGTPGAPMPPSLQLPQPVSDLKAARKADQVALTWTAPSRTNDRANLKRAGETRVCRSASEAILNQCDHPAGSVTPALGAAASYVDTLPKQLQDENPAGFATYAVEVMNDRGRSAGLSNQVRVTTAPTLAPPADFRAQLTPDGPVLLWSGTLHTHGEPELGHFFRVYRRLEGAASDSIAGEVKLRNQPEAELADRNFEWEKRYVYRITVVTMVTRGGQVVAEVEGEDSPPLTVLVHDSFPPAAPTGLQAVFSGQEQQQFIDLTWAPNTELDLAGYNVYRRLGGEAPRKINPELVKTPSFRDTNVAPGTTVYYSVSAVDLRGNESARSEEAHETVPR